MAGLKCRKHPSFSQLLYLIEIEYEYECNEYYWVDEASIKAAPPFWQP